MLENLRLAALLRMLHCDDYAGAGRRNEIHCAAHTLDEFSLKQKAPASVCLLLASLATHRNHPIRQIAVLATLHAAE